MRVVRRLRYKLYPSEKQRGRLRHLKWCHKELYNALLEQRRLRYQRFGETATYYDQSREITELRAASADELGREDNPWSALNRGAMELTAKRVHEAFEHFFRKCQDSEFTGKPGFPRYKSYHRYNGWSYRRKGGGYRLSPSHEMPRGKQDRLEASRRFVRNGGHLRLQEVGTMQARGGAPDRVAGLLEAGLGEVKRVTVLHKADGWYVSVCVVLDAAPDREREDSRAAGLDWGVEALATLATEGGGAAWEEIANPRLLQKVEAKIKSAQRKASRKERFSNGWKRAKGRVARLQQKLTRQRKDLLHKATAYLASNFALIATEDLDVRGMVSSTRETNVHQKAALNRSILDTSPGRFLRLLGYKAEEAGGRVEQVDTREVKPSQTCHRCGEQRKKELSERWHRCECGTDCSRDYNAARVMLNVALYGEPTGRGPARRGGSDQRGPPQKELLLKREVQLEAQVEPDDVSSTPATPL